MHILDSCRIQRSLRTVIACTTAVLGTVAATPTVAHAVVSPCWRPPVIGVVVDPFRAPPCTWCAGNRGLEFRVPRSVTVHAAATGTVSFAGTVVGVDYVVVDLPANRRLTYGRLTHIDVEVGDVVIAGQVLGRASSVFFFGLRENGVYTDPEPFIGTLRGRARLVPIDGTPARPPGAPEVSCQGARRRR